MFGFSLASQLFQGSAQRTWNCVTQFTNLLWYKLNHIRHPIMPRSRRRHHSRSRSRSRSHSHDRDRDAKRRKIESVDSPAQKRSVSCEPESPTKSPVPSENSQLEVQVANRNVETEEPKTVDVDSNSAESSQDDTNTALNVNDKSEKTTKQLEDKLLITPKKTMSPKQVQKKLESEKKRQQKQVEREEREKKKHEERERVRLQKEKEKQEKEELKNKKNEQKAKEREQKEEQKRKEKEEKEAKRKEKEEREEAKRKEREQEKLRKQQEIDEKNREKQKIEEQKQKAAQVFVNFFVPKKPESKVEEKKTSIFMPFEVKSDMKLAPSRRRVLTQEAKTILLQCLENPDAAASYLKDLKGGHKVGKCPRTWPYEEDVIIIDDDFGMSICDDKQKSKKMRVKFLKFHENKRPPYYGTWRKKSASINPRKPFTEDKVFFDYEVDSDDDWEEEEQGESLNGSDDEEKENEAETDDYEVDNEFFVPHGHLSDDEIDDEATSKLSPESHKQKLKLLKDEFDQDMQTKTNKMKPRSIGCVWYKKDGSNVDEAIDRYLRPLAIISNGQIVIKKRKDLIPNTPSRKYAKELRQELIPAFLKLIHGNVNRRALVVDDFINYMQNNGYAVEVSKAYLGKRLKQFAQWKKCTEEGPMLNKLCWCVEDDVKKRYNVE